MTREVPGVVVGLLAAGFVSWVLPFFLPGAQPPKGGTLDRRARWGIALEAAAFAIVFQPYFWSEHPAPAWRVVAGAAFLALAALLSWTGRRALGRQWRVDAGLNADHELVRSGPYRFVRHPIYASLLALILGDGLMLSAWWALWVALVIFIAGTEIRVRIEDNLLASRFGEPFRQYQRTVSAYVPLVR